MIEFSIERCGAFSVVKPRWNMGECSVSFQRAGLTLPKHCQAGALKGYEIALKGLFPKIARITAKFVFMDTGVRTK